MSGYLRGGSGTQGFRTTANLQRFVYGPRQATTTYVTEVVGGVGNDPITLSGDVTGSGTTTIVAELSDTGVTAGSYTNTNLTVDVDGRIIAASNGSGGVGGGGTVTSVAAGTGLTATPSPIVGAGTVALSVPVSVANGGTGATTAPLALTSLGAAPLASPTFTGDPKAPTPSPGDSDTSIATTAFVGAAITAAPNQAITLSGDIAGSGTAAITTTLPAVNSNVGTFQGLTVNAKGQVTAAANQSYLTGNQTITVTGDVDGSGTTAIALTLDTVNANVGSFTNANITVNGKGLITAAANGTAGGTGTITAGTAGEVALYTGTTTVDGFTMSGDATINASGVVTLATNSVVTTDITNANVTYAKIQNVAASRLLGNPTGSGAAPSEISLGTNLSFAGTVLNAASGASGLSGMTTGQIPIAATATTITSSGNLNGDVVSTATTLATTIQANAVTTTKINNAAVTYAKIQNVANNRILGNTSGSAAAPSEITLPLSAANGGTGLASGTSGGIPYYNTTTSLASSALLTANALVKGGGAGVAPVASTALVDSGGKLTIAGGLAINNNTNPALTTDGSYTRFFAPDVTSGAQMALGYATDPANYYSNGTHTFSNRAGSTDYASMTATGTIFGTPTGGAKGAGTINASGVYVNGASIGDNAAWTAYTPTVTPTSGTLTAATATGRYKLLGKTCFLQITISITTNGTAAASLNASLPPGVTSPAGGVWVLVGRETAVNGNALTFTIGAGGSTGQMVNYANGYPGGNGTSLNVSGVFETA